MADKLVTLGSLARYKANSTRDQMVFIGSSWEDGYGLQDGTQRWPSRLCRMLGLAEVNVAVAGAGFAAGGENSFDGQLARAVQQADPKRVRAVYIGGPRNDLIGGALGSTPDAIYTTLKAKAVDFYRKVRAAFPQPARIIAPYLPAGPWDMSADPDKPTTVAGILASHMADLAIADAARESDAAVELLDAPVISSWNTLISDTGQGDHVHLNGKGAQIAASMAVGPLNGTTYHGGSILRVWEGTDQIAPGLAVLSAQSGLVAFSGIFVLKQPASIADLNARPLVTLDGTLWNRPVADYARTLYGYISPPKDLDVSPQMTTFYYKPDGASIALWNGSGDQAVKFPAGSSLYLNSMTTTVQMLQVFEAATAASTASGPASLAEKES